MGPTILQRALARRPPHLLFCCAILGAFGLAKLGTVAARSIGALPPVRLSEMVNEYIMIWAGVLELIAVILALGVLSVKRACQLIALIGVCFLAYRFAMHQAPCPCLGAAPDLIPWLKLNERIILLTVPYGLLLLGLWGWAREAAAGARQEETPS